MTFAASCRDDRPSFAECASRSLNRTRIWLTSPAGFRHSPALSQFMEIELLPVTLDRKQFSLRWLAWFVFAALGLWLFIGAFVRTEVYLGWIALAVAYQVFGLAVPRLRSADQSLWLAALLLIPAINLAMIVFLFLVPPKTS